MPDVPLLRKAVKAATAPYVHVHHPEPLQGVDVSVDFTPTLEVNNPPAGATLHLEVVVDGQSMPYLPPAGAFSFPLTDPMAIYTVFGLPVPAGQINLVFHVWVLATVGGVQRTYRKAVPFFHQPAVVIDVLAAKAPNAKEDRPKGKKKK